MTHGTMVFRTVLMIMTIMKALKTSSCDRGGGDGDLLRLGENLSQGG